MLTFFRERKRFNVCSIGIQAVFWRIFAPFTLQKYSYCCKHTSEPLKEKSKVHQRHFFVVLKSVTKVKIKFFREKTKQLFAQNETSAATGSSKILSDMCGNVYFLFLVQNGCWLYWQLASLMLLVVPSPFTGKNLMALIMIMTMTVRIF